MNTQNTLLTFAALAALLAGCVGNDTPVAVPAPIQARSGETLAQIVPAKGVQIYECRAVKDKPGAFEWGFVAPDAELFDTRGRKIGTHYAGPKWEAADGSIISGTLSARAEAPRSADIPWLLLNTTPSGAAGSFSKVTGIQRVNTVGGVAPAMPCGAANAGTQARVPYTADYYLLARG